MMDARRRMLLSEIDLQCGFALKAYSGMAAALEHRDPEAFWYAMQALLAAAAHVHRFLEDDPALRAALDISDDSPLRNSELDSAADVRFSCLQWLASRPRGPIRMSNFGPLGVSEADAAVFARFIDLENSACLVFGMSYDLPPLLAAIAGLSSRVKADLRQLREVV
jgi:hypothetical protein